MKIIPYIIKTLVFSSAFCLSILDVHGQQQKKQVPISKIQDGSVQIIGHLGNPIGQPFKQRFRRLPRSEYTGKRRVDQFVLQQVLADGSCGVQIPNNLFLETIISHKSISPFFDARSEFECWNYERVMAWGLPESYDAEDLSAKFSQKLRFTYNYQLVMFPGLPIKAADEFLLEESRTSDHIERLLLSDLEENRAEIIGFLGKPVGIEHTASVTIESDGAKPRIIKVRTEMGTEAIFSEKSIEIIEYNSNSSKDELRDRFLSRPNWNKVEVQERFLAKGLQPWFRKCIDQEKLDLFHFEGDDFRVETSLFIRLTHQK